MFCGRTLSNRFREDIVRLAALDVNLVQVSSTNSVSIYLHKQLEVILDWAAMRLISCPANRDPLERSATGIVHIQIRRERSFLRRLDRDRDRALASCGNAAAAVVCLLETSPVVVFENDGADGQGRAACVVQPNMLWSALRVHCLRSEAEARGR